MPSLKDDLNDLVKENASEKDIMKTLDEITKSELETASNMHRRNTIRNVAATAITATGAAVGAVLSNSKGGAAIGAAVALISPVVTWGNARIAYEVIHQILNDGSANVSGSLTKSMKSLETFEGNNFDTNSNAFKILQSLEKQILAEGNKWGPDLNSMRKDLTKSQVLRQAIFDTQDLSRGDQRDLVDKSTAVVESFESWARVQKGRYTPILTFVSNIFSSDKKEIPRVR